MALIEGCVFREMLLNDAPNLSDEHLDLCQEDLVLMANTEGWEDEATCYAEWRRRIGRAFLPYAKTLAAMKRREGLDRP